MSIELSNNLLESAKKILLKYPLCNHCLGRLFAKLGYGLGNDDRGYSLKLVLTMELHRIIRNNGDNYKDLLRKLAENGGEPLTKLYKHLYNETISSRECILCKNIISRKYFEELADKAIKAINEYNATSFLIGVSIDRELQLKEIEIASESGLEYSESIKNEIKREVGKIVRDKSGIEPDFNRPDIVVVFDLTGNYDVIVNPVLLLGRYWKTARNISHVVWITRGIRKYPYSIEEFFNEALKEVYDAERVVLHASGREDVDVRMLGTGRPMVLEIKNPRFRLVDYDLLNSLVVSNRVQGEIIGQGSRKHIELLKMELSKKSKIYKALIYVSEPIGEEKLCYLEEFFTNKVVRQLTPKRILYRKKERLRTRKVYQVKTRYIDQHLFEALIRSDGGLYIKELISGDDGRTTPSFTEILGVNAHCIELDVIGVEVPLLP